MKLKRFWLGLPLWVRNKYSVAGLAFLIWMSFMDTNSLSTQYKLSQEIEELEQAKLHYEKQLEADLKALEQLSGPDEELEKFARETYRMSKEGEDVFIINTDKLELE